jgi:hypothetical protein
MLRDLLASADPLDQWESDPTIDYDELRRNIAAAKPEIEAILGFSLKEDQNSEDAQWVVTWFIYEPGFYDEAKGSGALVYRFAVAFSAFAKLACVHTNYWAGSLNGFPVAAVEEKLRQFGFTPVPHSEMQVPYDGVNLQRFVHASWWDRFFGYV